MIRTERTSRVERERDPNTFSRRRSMTTAKPATTEVSVEEEKTETPAPTEACATNELLKRVESLERELKSKREAVARGIFLYNIARRRNL